MNQFASYAKYYDDMYQSKDYRAETDLIKEVFTRYNQNSVRSILSLGCGTGTYEIILGKQGFELTGVDVSADMLQEAKEKIANAELNDKITLVESDIRHLPSLGKTYDAAIMMFNIAGYFHTVDDLTAVVKEVSKYLKSGGTFQFDAWYGPAVIVDPPADRTRKVEKNGKLITRVTKASLDQTKKLVRISFDVTEEKDGQTNNHIQEDHPMRYWDLSEVESAITSGGLQLVKTTAWDNLDLPVTDKQWDMQIIAIKE